MLRVLAIWLLVCGPAAAQVQMQGRVTIQYGQSNNENFGLHGVPYPLSFQVSNNFRIFTQGVYNASNPKGVNCVEGCWPKYEPSVNSASCAGLTSTAWSIEARIGQLFMQDTPNIVRYFLKVCPGGTGLLQNPTGNDWSPRSNGNNKPSAWGDLINTWNAAKALNTPWTKYYVDSVIYVGSETDTQNASAPANIKRDLFNLDDAVRAEFGPFVKHIFIKPPNMAPNGPYTPDLWAAMDAVAAARQNVYVVDASDMVWQGATPGLFGHYSAASTVTIAERIYPFIKLP